MNTMMLACGGPEIVFLGYAVFVILPALLVLGIGSLCAASQSLVARSVGRAMGWFGVVATSALALTPVLSFDPKIIIVAIPFMLIASVFPMGCSLVVIRKNNRPIPITYPACKGCGYNLTGNVSGVCPECGKRVEWYEARS